MPNYPTYDTFPELDRIDRLFARPLNLIRVTEPELQATYENGVMYSTAESYGSRAAIFSFSGTAGATYAIASSSHFDPGRLVVYDNEGRAIAYDTGDSSAGTDTAFFIAPYSGRYYVDASWDQGPTPADRAAAIGIYEDLDTVPPTRAVVGTAGDDTFDDTYSVDIVDGGAGLDTFSTFAPRAEYAVALEDGVVSLSHRDTPYEVDQLTNVERIWFSDGYLSFETEGFVAEAYRLYQAAFDRKPDESGLGFWIRNMSDGMDLHTVAGAFLQSAEFVALYAAPSNDEIVTRLYWNILDRAPEQDGFEHWTGLLDSGALDTADLLVAFSESVENTARTHDEMSAGYFFFY